jgi:hypothetical protein
MNAAARLYDEYQQKLRELQDKDCPHTVETDWMEGMVGARAQHRQKGQSMRQLQQGDAGQKVLRWMRKGVSRRGIAGGRRPDEAKRKEVLCVVFAARDGLTGWSISSLTI